MLRYINRAAQHLFSVVAMLVGLNLYGQVPNPQIKLVAKVNCDFSEKIVEDLGGTIGSRIGDILTITCNHNQLNALRRIYGMEYLEQARAVKPNLERAIPDLRVDSVYQAIGLEQSYTGKGVIIGVTDWGFDYTHPMFYDTTLSRTRILAAWDQYKQSGPAPSGFDYGTEYVGQDELLEAQSDTANIYGYGTHGSHVAGIAGGSGGGTRYRGVAYEANFLFTTFLIDEAAVLDAFSWMYHKALDHNSRLVINMSWGLYHMGTLDGTSLLSQAIDEYSRKGVVFVTSGGNNGDETFHIKKDFNQDTLQSRVEFYSYSANPNMWGQSISAWGEPGNDFGARVLVLNSSNDVIEQTIPFYTSVDFGSNERLLIIGLDTIVIRLDIDQAHPLNKRPHMRIRIKNTNTSLRIGLQSFANKGTVHYWNVTELTTDVGNWGMPFSALLPGWTDGDNRYSLGEPASTKSVITVAAHASEVRLQNGSVVGGRLTGFSSLGPTIDGRLKPDISAPGNNVASSISSFTTSSVTTIETVDFEGRSYPFARFSGTSMSSPATAGVVALMLEANNGMKSEDVKKILIETAREDANTGMLSDTGSTAWGWGKVNAVEAVRHSEKLKAADQPRLLIYPNPAQNKLYLDFETVHSHPLIIYTINGEKVFQGYINSIDGVDISHLTAGVYTVSVNHSSEPYQKLVVVR